MSEMTKKFAKAILNRRKELGLTQEELANRVGTTKQMVSKYENAQRSPKVTMANAFADALETTLDELLGVEKDNSELENESFHAKNNEVKLLIRGLNKLSPEQLEQATAMFKVMFAPQYAELFAKENDDDT